MARTNSFTIKASLTTLLFLISLICFYISYSDLMKIKDEETIIFDEMDINYFDKKKFQKYYEIISNLPVHVLNLIVFPLQHL